MENKPTAKRSKIPYIFFIFFGVIIAVNVGYIYLAKKTWRGVTTEGAYQKGLDYNEILEQEKKQKELGWKVDIKSRNIGGNKYEITINVFDKKLSPLKEANIGILFKRPTQEGFDFAVSTTSAEGVYKLKVDFPLKGQWDAVISINKDEDKLYLARRYIIK